MTRSVLRWSSVMSAIRRVRAAVVLLLLILAVHAPRVRAQTPAARPPIPGAPAGVTAFVNVNVIPMDTERVLANQTVLVEGGWITALGPTTRLTVPAGATQIDGQGQYLIPGLADMHAHIGMGSGGGLGEKVLFHWLAYGVTTIRNMDWAGTADGGGSLLVLQLRERAARGELWSPRIYVSTGTGVQDGSSYKAFGPVHVAAAVVAAKARGYDHIKPYKESPASFDSLVAAARRVGIPLMGHVPDSVPLERALASGVYRSIEHLTGYYGLEGSQLNRIADLNPAVFPALAAATKRAGVWNTPTLAFLEALTAFTKRTRPELSPSRDSGNVRDRRDLRVIRARQLVKALQDAGAGLLLGVDAGGMWGAEGDLLRGPGSHDELAALVRAGLTPYQALATGTRNVAVFYGTLDSMGTVGVGKRADLVLVGDNPLADIAHTRRIAGVMLGGRWLGRAELDRRLAAFQTP